MANKVKIYAKNNYLLIDVLDTDDTTVTSRLEGLAKDVLVRTATDVSTTFFFNGVNGADAAGYDLANILDENGDAYADRAAFETFYTSNTGNFNSGGATPLKQFNAVMQQSGTSAPVVYQLIGTNALGFEPAFSYADVGTWGIGCPNGEFAFGSAICFVQSAIPEKIVVADIESAAPDYISITQTFGGVVTDSAFFYLQITLPN